MANLSKEKIAELKKIVRDDYGKELTDAEASEIARGIVDYFALLPKIHHRQIQEEKQ